MLNLSNLKVDIEGSRILNGISLTVAAGELVCLVASDRPAGALRARNSR